MLGEFVLSSHNHQSHDHYIDEMLTLFPTLQFGMDVNPKFTAGPTGVEYTQNVTAFELLSIELVHGWLLDSSKDTDTVQLVGSKTYNELVEQIIAGNDASCEIDRIVVSIQELESKLKEMEECIDVAAEREVATVASAMIVAPTTGNIESKGIELSTDNEDSGGIVVQDNVDERPAAEVAIPAPKPPESLTDDKWKARGEIEFLSKKLEGMTQKALQGALLNGFLETTGHQLTEYGLQELNKYLADDCLCVFFRNNHFSTLTKNNGKLYTLVTDLGYASVPEVVWEELDSIDGDTEYFNSMFVKLAPLKGQTTTGTPMLTPEQMLAQRGQSESDFRFALQLSRREGVGPQTQAELDLAAATEASLREFSGPDPEPNTPLQKTGTIVRIPGLNDTMTSDPSNLFASNGVSSGMQEDQDAMIAQQLQAQMENDYADEASVVLARQLQAEDRLPATTQNTRVTSKKGTTSKDSSCVVS